MRIDTDMGDSRMLYFSIVLGMLLSTALALAVAFLIWLLLHPLDVVDTALITRAFIYPPALFHPELVEKLQYIAGLIIFPIALYGSQKMFMGLLKRRNGRSLAILYAALSIATVLLVYSLYTTDLIENPSYVPGAGATGLFATAAAIVALLFAYLVLESRRAALKKISALAFTLVSAALIAFIASMNVFSRYYVTESVIFLAFNAFFYPVSQVFAGKALLVDLTDQYGLYPHFLEPLFRLTGLSVLSFTAVMAALLGISYLCMCLFLRSSVRSKAVALLGFLAIASFSYFSYAVSGDPYFQFYPLRLLFPSLLILLSWIYFNGHEKWAYYASFVLFSLGVLWNLETGIVVYLAWILGLLYDGLSRGAGIGQLQRHVRNGAVFLPGIVAAYAAYIYLRYGSFPDFLGLVKYQAYYYGFGFFMLPMKPIHPWNLAILAYMVGIAYSIRSLALKDHSPRSSSIFLLSVLGAGVFVYFQGRSHDSVLPLVLYPALLLLTLYTDDLLAITAEGLRLKKIRAHQMLLLFLALSVMAFALIGAATGSGTLYDMAVQRQSSVPWGQPTELTEGVEFIGNHTYPGEKVLIVSYNAGVYYAETGTQSPLSTPGLSEAILVSDYSKICEYIVNGTTAGDKVFLDAYYLDYYGFDDENSAIVRALFRHYRAAGGSARNSMMLFEKARDDITYSLNLTPEGPERALFHCTYDPAADAYRTYGHRYVGLSKRLSRCNVTLPDNYSIELAVAPRNEAAGATLLSNHVPGRVEGFTIRRADAGGDVYEYVVGAGAQALRFKLDDGSASDLVITAGNGSLKAYVNGRIADSADGAVPVRNTGACLAIGNDASLERPFNGTIDEVRIVSGNLTDGIGP